MSIYVLTPLARSDIFDIWSYIAEDSEDAAAPSAHEVTEARERGWNRISNGELLKAAEVEGFDLLLTTDRRIRYQQNLAGRNVALVVLTGTTKWARVRLHLERIADAVNAVTPGSYTKVEIPWTDRNQQRGL
ncbi:MAG TPA: hypothetical protein VN776_00385 [Terracidiphilus sp.]|nr:hypothetical protein [Terracidiphilus sp.]